MSSTEDTMYKKRIRTTGMSGQLYETKLVGFALFKLLHDEQIEYFYLASNLDEIGCFDDLCFKAKIRGIDRPLLVFIQAKHKEDDNAYVDFDEAKHFHDSYSRVVQKFYLGANDKKNKDKIFIGNFEDYECVFILYTNGKYKNDSGIDYESAYSSVLNHLLSTGRNGTKLLCTDQIVEDLVEAVLKVEIEGLAEHFTKFLSASQSMQMMLDDDVKRYHVVLALNAVNVSEIYSDEKKPDTKWRIMTFRDDFFTSKNKNLTTLRKAMFKKILQNHAISKNKKPIKDPKLEEQLQNFFKEPCLNSLIPLIGTCIVYKNEKFEFASQRTENEKEILKQIKLSQDIIEEAEAIVARNILLSPELKELKVPVTFGNTDLMISERRITHLTKNIVDLCKKFRLENGHKIVTLDETIDPGILNINGGLGGTVGNLLVNEDSTNLLKFADSSASLQNNARLLFEKLLLQDDLADLCVYRFYVKPMLPFPILSFDCDSGIARKISSKLVIYAGQSDQKILETKLKKQIEEYQKSKYPNMQVQAESLFQNYHSNIQTWSLLKSKGPYLTKDSKIYQEALNNIFFEPQMSSLRNTFHMTKMKHIEYSTESLKTLQKLSRQKDEEEELKLAEMAVIVTDVAILTAIKVIQYLRSNGVNSYSILDLECLLNLPTEDFCALKLELKKTEKVLLVMCHNLQSGMIWYEKYLKEIAQVVEGKRKIVITNSIFVDMVQNVFSPSDKENTKKEIDDNNIINEKHSLVDLTQESREDIMKNSNIIFQGQITSLDLFLDETSVPFIEGVILNKIVFNETIEIGELHSDANYDEISHLYQDRTVEYIKCHLIAGRICISSTICVTDGSQASSSNHLASNQQGEQLVGSIFSISNTDSGVNENPFSMYFHFDVRIHLEKCNDSKDTDIFIVVFNANLESRFRVKIKNFLNKVWSVKVTLFDDSMRLRNWLKDESVLDDTLKALRYLCHGAVINNLILSEDVVLIPTDHSLDKEKDLQCFWFEDEGFENNGIIDAIEKDCDNNVTTNEDSGHNTIIEVVQKNYGNHISTINGPRDSDHNIKAGHVQSDFDNNATEDDRLKDFDTNFKDHIHVAADNKGTIDEDHKNSDNNSTVDGTRKYSDNNATINYDNNVTIDDEQKNAENNATIDDTLKDSGINIKDHIQTDSDNNVTINEKQKDANINAITDNALKDSDTNFKDHAHMDSDNNATIDDTLNDFDNTAVTDDALKKSDNNYKEHAQIDSDNNVNIEDEQKDSEIDATIDVALKDSDINLKDHIQNDSESIVTIDAEQKDSDNNVITDDALNNSATDNNATICDALKESDNNSSTNNALKDSGTNFRDHIQIDSYNNGTKDEEQKDTDNNATVDSTEIDSDHTISSDDALQVSDTNFKDHAQIDADNNATTDDEQKDSENNAPFDGALKDSGTNIKDHIQTDSDSNVTDDEKWKDSDAQKKIVKAFRKYFERSFFHSVPDITFVANNLPDESLLKDKQENIYEDHNNLCLDDSLSKCEENAHNFQITFRSKHRIELKTFEDLKDDIVILTAKAGLGKSTVLTHLSRKINKLNKHVWVVRINLLNYSGEFRKWQRSEKIKIDTLTTLSLMVQVMFKNIIVDLKEDAGKIVFENCSGDEWTRFNLKMFFNYYDNGKLLFIFDGYDEICPDYTNEVLLFLNVVKNYPRKNKMWITSRPYNAILPDLEQRFGKSFRLEYLNKTEQTEYLRRFWNKTINIKDASIDVLESLVTIIYVVIVVVDIKLKIICYDFYKYVVAKFPQEHSDEIKVRMEVIEKVYESVSKDMSSEDNEFMGTPLLLHLIAGFFVAQVLDIRNLEKVGRVNSITMYKWFIETKLKRILFIDKYHMNIDIPFVKERCEAELNQSLILYKKLGAQAIFGNPIFVRNGLNFEEFNDLAPFNLSTESGKTEFKAALDRIWTGKDKTGLISYVTDEGTPVFIHKTFAEYFAVEYISDIFKNETVPYETKKLVMTVMLSIMLKESVIDDHCKLVSRGSLANWVREKCIVDEDYMKIGEDILEKEPLINKYNSVVNTIRNDTLRRAYVRLINSTTDDYEDPSFKEGNIEDYLSGKRKFDDDLFLMMKPHFRKKFPEYSKFV